MQHTLRRLVLFVLFLTASASADAQIGRTTMRFGQPSAFASLGVGFLQSFTVSDGATASRWEFGDATQYVASLEKAFSNGASFGLRGTTARVPLSYLSTATSVRQDADANVSQLFAAVHVENGTGLHSVLELNAGATAYSNFRERAGGSRLPPAGMDLDFSFAFGYGLGYAFSRNLSVDVVQDVATSVHQNTGLSAGTETSARLHGTRIMARFALGG